MKLYYDKRLSDPTYYVQVGIRKGKKVTSKNISKIGKHSELLKDHSDPLAYAKKVVADMNENKNISTVNLTVNLKKNLKIMIICFLLLQFPTLAICFWTVSIVH